MTPTRAINARVAVTMLAALGLSTAAVAQLSVALNPKPQYASNSCRSYALALAMGTVPGSSLSVTTAKDLRSAERDLQSRLEGEAAAMNSNAGDHAVWKAVVEKMSSGKLELNLEYIKSYDEFYNRVRELTKVDAADTLGPLFSIALVKTPVMTSVTRIGASHYADGHIVTVFGVSGQPLSPTPLVILNPAVRVADKTRNACELGDVPNDEKWSAVASIEGVYDLKRFDKGYLIMWVRKK